MCRFYGAQGSAKRRRSGVVNLILLLLTTSAHTLFRNDDGGGREGGAKITEICDVPAQDQTSNILRLLPHTRYDWITAVLDFMRGLEAPLGRSDSLVSSWLLHS